jgi:hypothetical protein
LKLYSAYRVESFYFQAKITMSKFEDFKVVEPVPQPLQHELVELALGLVIFETSTYDAAGSTCHLFRPTFNISLKSRSLSLLTVDCCYFPKLGFA